MDSRQRQAWTAAIIRMSVFLSVLTGVVGIPGTLLAAEELTHGGTRTVGLAADIAHFDVFQALGYEAYWALENIQSGLVRTDAQGHIRPARATFWDIKDEGRTDVFHLLEPQPPWGSGSPKRWPPVTPAMAAGITDHVWTMEELRSYRVPPDFRDQLDLQATNVTA